MSAEVANGNGPAFTQKEMLVRIDAKVDVIASKQAGYDVELALLKARANKLEEASKELDDALEEAKERQDSILTRINVAAGAVSIILFLSPALWILVNRLVNS